MALLDEIRKLAKGRTVLIDDVIERMEKAVSFSQRRLLDTVVEEYLDKLERNDDGSIKSSSKNRTILNKLDSVYETYQAETAPRLGKTIVDGVRDIINFNGKYYGLFGDKVEIGTIQETSRAQVSDWLGITNRGGLVENGYLNTLLRDQSVKNYIKDTMFRSLVGQKGFFETKKDLKIYLDGDPGNGTSGALQKYYRNFVYDTFSQVDRTQAKIFADKLKFKYAIYEGGLVEKSREFCIKRNGKVFSDDEIEKFNPQVARPPNYNPFTDLGGYGCRHHLNWIPDVVAFAMRPDLKKAA